MGGHYGSIHVRTNDREAIGGALEEIARDSDRKFLLGPTLDGWISIYPNDSAGDVAEALARAVPNPVLHTTVYDDDLFSYAYYEAGKLLDEYSSEPDCFEEASAQERERLRGKPEVFHSLLDSERKIAELRELLSAGGTDGGHRFVFESDRLEGFASLFGIQNAVTSYEYLMDGEREGIKGWKEFLHIPDRAVEISARKAAAAALRSARKQLQQQGLLCAESLPPDKSRNKGCWRAEIHTDSTKPGFLIRWWKHAGYPPREPELFQLEPPWPAQSKPTPMALLPATGNAVATAPLPAGCGPVWAVHPGAHLAATRPRQDQLGIVNLESGKLEKALFCGTVSDWSSVAGMVEHTFRQAGVSDRDLAEWKGAFVSGSYDILNCRFSPGGNLLLCATTAGVQIFEWHRVVAAARTLPKPMFSVNPVPESAGAEQNYASYVYDLLFDEARNRVLFGGAEGRIRFLELADGRHGTLLDPPGRMAIIRLNLSCDRETFCCLCSPGFQDDQPWRVQVWNYRALASLAGLGW